MASTPKFTVAHARKRLRMDNPQELKDCLMARSIVTESGCRRWTGSVGAAGYGQICVDGRVRPVHVIAHEIWIGPVPEGYEVDHVRARGCQYRDCFTPCHLEAVTRAENRRRARRDIPWVRPPRARLLEAPGVVPGVAKLCKKCRLVKPLSEFTCDSSKPDGHRNECRDCKHAVAAEYRSGRLEDIRVKSAKWRTENPGRASESSQRSYRQLRKAVLDHYGHACACCDSAERLHVDHVNGDGAAHRMELFGDPVKSSTGSFYRWLIANNFPDGFQTLCERCNRSKGSGPRCLLDHSLQLIAGVSYRPGASQTSPWQARIGKRYLGVFATREEAIGARQQAERLVREERRAS